MVPIRGKYRITQEYGLTDFARSAKGRATYKNFPGGMHPGIDFGTYGVNSEIVAMFDGEVTIAGGDPSPTKGWGLHIMHTAPDGWGRNYAHCSDVYVKVGDKVKRGDVIGRVGTTGASTGIHLHYGKRRRKLLGGWEYADPTGDLSEETAPVKMALPAPGFVQGATPEIYLWTGKTLHYIPDMETFGMFKFSKVTKLESDVISKLPVGDPIPSLK